MKINWLEWIKLAIASGLVYGAILWLVALLAGTSFNLLQGYLFSTPIAVLSSVGLLVIVVPIATAINILIGRILVFGTGWFSKKVVNRYFQASFVGGLVVLVIITAISGSFSITSFVVSIISLGITSYVIAWLSPRIFKLLKWKMPYE